MLASTQTLCRHNTTSRPPPVRLTAPSEISPSFTMCLIFHRLLLYSYITAALHGYMSTQIGYPSLLLHFRHPHPTFVGIVLPYGFWTVCRTKPTLSRSLEVEFLAARDAGKIDGSSLYNLRRSLSF